MRFLQFKRAFGIIVAAAFCCGKVVAADASSGTATPALTALQIFQTARDKYASLRSYSDQGRIITTIAGTAISTEFSTRLARPGFYRIEWKRYTTSPYSGQRTGIQGAWCSASGNYTQMGMGVRRQPSRTIAFANLASSPSGEVVAVPTIFFSPYATESPDQIIIGLTRLSDARIGKIECYQLTGQTVSGQTRTFWIGKRDFLIHQIQTVAGPQTMKAAWLGATGGHFEPPVLLHGYSSIETYTNILRNAKFSPADFMPSFPIFRQTTY